MWKREKIQEMLWGGEIEGYISLKNEIPLLISEQLAARMRSTIPSRQQNAIINHLIDVEVTKREELISQGILELEENSELNKEREDWDDTLNDGLEE